MAAKIKKNDEVIVIAGKDKGKTGKVLSRIDDKVVVQGINIAKVHKKPTMNTPGQIAEVEKPIHVSNVSLMENGKAVKVKFEVQDGKKVRISKKSGNKVGE